MDPTVVQFLILAVFIIGSALGIVFYVGYRNNQKVNANWSIFSIANKLDFTPETSWDDQPCVTGEYQGYHIALEVTQKGDGAKRILGTRIMLEDWKTKSLQRKEILGQPLTLQDTISQFTTLDSPYPLMGKIDAIPSGRQVFYEQDSVETNVEQLQYLLDLLVNMANAYPKIMAAGGRAIPFLQKNARLALIKGNNSLRPITLQLLQEIAQETRRLEPQISRLLCKHCLTRCCSHKIDISPLEFITYYGCRICSQSQEFVDWAGPVVALLDSEMEDKLSKGDKLLRVNWSVHRAVFDFEAVEIIQASDEDVERFVVQIGNDTDQLRQPRYKEMNCTILPGCELSENTMRILHRTFGQVEVKQMTSKQFLG